MRKKSNYGKLIALTAFVLFTLLFTYSSLNLRNTDYGYEKQRLKNKKKELKETIDLLSAKKAILLDLGRVERIVVQKLGYDYPKKGQIIKVYGE
ncbi:MAG: hypothetical protein KAS21_06950 [Candidatus Aminicenantes bacterium]|nr:hypothetical protein [Candidatus Aminicenantes bacterium]MCK5004806.1 hypothetical protein [Candidatus Aminicenantes bacterium]